jgi:hypothetical protein
MHKWFIKLRIGLLHATYHRNIKKADAARELLDIIKFRKYVYRAEDAWRKLVLLTEKTTKKQL